MNLPMTFADEAILNLSMCTLNTTAVSLVSGSSPTVTNAGGDDCSHAFLGSSRNVINFDKWVNTSASNIYIIWNISIVVSGGGRLLTFHNGTFDGASLN